MAFLNNLSEKLAQAGHSSMQKTKEMTDIVKIKGSIFNEEKKINEIYVKIGQLYTQMHGEDYSEEFKDLMETYIGIRSRIEEYKNKINEIQKMKKCSNCGYIVNERQSFCPKCGVALAKEEPKEPVGEICAACGGVLRENAKFCTSCGAPVQREQTV